MSDAFSTIRRARSLRDRHPDAPLSVIAIALCLATYADGKTGSNIWPGHDELASQTGIALRTVRHAIKWLIERGELRRDQRAYPGSRARYTYLGVEMEAAGGRRDQNGGRQADNGGRWTTDSGRWQPPEHPKSNTKEEQDPKDPCQHCGGPLLVYNAGTDEAFVSCTVCHWVATDA